MTRPTDSSIARAFWFLVESARIHEKANGRTESVRIRSVIRAAAKFDAESPAGPARDSEEICDCGYVRGSFGCDDAHKIAPKVPTSPERVQIPAESKHVQCPRCPAHMPVGLHCGGPNCPLRK